MDNAKNRCAGFIATILVFIVASGSGIALADPPDRVARLGYISGGISFSPAGEDDWVDAVLNRPLMTGDRLWADVGARAELQIGGTALRLDSDTSVTLLNLDDHIAQFQLAQGVLNMRVRYLDPNQLIEIDTPDLAYVIRQPGQYRISVDPNADATEVLTRRGQSEVYGGDASYVIDSGRSYRFVGTGLSDYEALELRPLDDFDRWAQARDRIYEHSVSARYVSRDVIGYQDLDANGTWRTVPQYGNVWTPTNVSADWVPYRDGHWAWVDPWGWTWVDDAPWGFAVSHYGRWADIGGRWGWIPGPVAARAVYAPALVAFVGGGNFEVGISSGAVGWFPLGPRDVYRPAYTVSRNYFTNVNVSNTVINNTNIVNIYNNRNTTNVVYVNQQVPGAVVAVPTSAFVHAQPVARAALRVAHDSAASAPVIAVAAIAPTLVSVAGAGSQAHKKPTRAVERAVVAKNVPPPAPVPFADRERALATHPGKPIDAETLAKLKTSNPAPARKLEVVAPVRQDRQDRQVATPPDNGGRSRSGGKSGQRSPSINPDARVSPAPAAEPPKPAEALQRTAPRGARESAPAPGVPNEPAAQRPPLRGAESSQPRAPDSRGPTGQAERNKRQRPEPSPAIAEPALNAPGAAQPPLATPQPPVIEKPQSRNNDKVRKPGASPRATGAPVQDAPIEQPRVSPETPPSIRSIPSPKPAAAPPPMRSPEPGQAADRQAKEALPKGEQPRAKEALPQGEQPRAKEIPPKGEQPRANEIPPKGEQQGDKRPPRGDKAHEKKAKDEHPASADEEAKPK